LERPDATGSSNALVYDPGVSWRQIVGGVILVLFVWRRGLESWTILRELMRLGTLPMDLGR